MNVYYNENDPFCVEWLRNLMLCGYIPGGEIDSRSIVDVQGEDLTGFTQCHFFAGIAGWAYALDLAGWGEREVWTGSCPCQPFSAAGKRKGVNDARHLWPEFNRLIAERKPATVFGEQVASKDGRVWLAGVRTDLEALGYAVGAADLCAAGIGAPHIRQRLYWVADAVPAGRPERGPCTGYGQITGRGSVERMADTERNARDPRGIADQPAESNGAQATGLRNEFGRCGDVSGMGDAQSTRRLQPAAKSDTSAISGQSRNGFSCDGGLGDPNNNKRPQRRGERFNQCIDQFAPWAAGEFIQCTDGKARRAQSGIFPLAHGIPNRMGVLRGSGNAIVPALAAEFISAVMECVP